jgi:hypothetical protein
MVAKCRAFRGARRNAARDLRRRAEPTSLVLAGSVTAGRALMNTAEMAKSSYKNWVPCTGGSDGDSPHQPSIR